MVGFEIESDFENGVVSVILTLMMTMDDHGGIVGRGLGKRGLHGLFPFDPSMKKRRKKEGERLVVFFSLPRWRVHEPFKRE